MKEEWEGFYIDCYESNKALNVLYGKHTNAFIQQLIPKVINFITRKVKVSNIVSRNLVKLLMSWREISRILSITYISPEKEEWYKTQMAYYKLLVAQFKSAAKHTIFSPRSASETEETNENYYSHVVINYTIPIMEQTFNQFRCGMGIFSMQGIERRNKESKNCAVRFTNNRFNLCTSTMKRLFDLFFFGGVEYE